MSATDLLILPCAPESDDLRLLLSDAVEELKLRYGPRAGSAVQDDAEFYVAYREGEAVGCAGLQPVSPRVVELKRMFVPCSERGGGVARALLAALEQRVVSQGVGTMRLQTGTRQVEAVSLYVSAGYQSVECWGNYAADANAICFEKDLV